MTIRDRRWVGATRALWVGILLVAGAGARLGAAAVFSEIHYHPASHDPREEFVEIHNPGTAPSDLGGWRIAGGIDFVFPPGTVVPGGGHVLVVADPVRFHELHPAASGVAGAFVGRLANSGARLELHDASGALVNRVTFGQDGEWARRVRSPVDHGHRGWEWEALHDGGGRSLELIQPGLDNGSGQNWAASLEDGGTPGRANSVSATDVAPLILDVRQYPVVPTPSDLVIVQARLVDEGKSGLTVRLRHRRIDGAEEAFAEVPMRDDGRSGDGLAGDGIWGATLPARPSGSLVEFHLEATDAGGRSRTWPAPAWEDGVARQVLDAFYSVDDLPSSDGLPLYRLLMRPDDRATLLQINRNQPSAPAPTSDQTRSHARFNATFVGMEDGRAVARHGVLVRNRGNGSRFRSPQSFRVDFPTTERWNGARGLNLNTQYPDVQLAGSALARAAGLAAAASRAVQLRVNGANHAFDASPSHGFLVANEVIDADFAERQFPLDGEGNLYRAQRLDGVAHAALDDRGPNPDAYRSNYFKRSHQAEDDWTDLIELCRVASLPDAEAFRRELPRVADVGQWVRYFAFNTLVDNRETSPVNGHGDDYFLYRGVRDPRFQLLPYDLDAILNAGDSPGRVTAGLFPMLDGNVTNFVAFLTDPEFAPRYFAELRRQARAVFAPGVVEPRIEQVLAGAGTTRRRQTMKDFAIARAAFVLSAIPERLTAASDLATNGLPETADATVLLHGQADPERTWRVRVNGAEANWVTWQARWTNPAVALVPGENRVLVQALDREGREIDRTYLDVRRSVGGAMTAVSGTLSGETRWTTARGPYRLTGTATVPAGATLVIEPGTTVYGAANAGLRIEGRLLAEGTPEARIRFRAAPELANPTNAWAGLEFVGSRATNWMVSVDIEHAGSARHSVRVSDSTLVLEDARFAGTTTTYVETSNSSLWVRGCEFPSVSGAELIHGGDIPAGGFLVIEGNRFGTTTGLNDIIDFSRARRPGPILQVRGNVFTGASDDVLDLDGCDAHIEGNVFLNVSNGDPADADTSSAVSYGEDGGYGPHVVVARNLFVNVDHLALCKEGGFLTLEHNTAVKVGLAAVNFSEPLRGVLPGAGARLRGNLFAECPANFENLKPANGTVAIDVSGNALAASDAAEAGPDNLVWPAGYPVPLPAMEDLVRWPAQRSLAALAPYLGSPAARGGPGGLDLGASIPPGALALDPPPARTWRTRFVLRVAGAGIVEYRARLDGGDWTSARPVSDASTWHGLAAGSHRVELIGRDSAGRWQDEVNATRLEWVVDPASARVVLNRVKAGSANLVAGMTTPDLVELYNDGPADRDLGGHRLRHGQGEPRDFVLPSGTLIPAGGRLVLSSGPTGIPGVLPMTFQVSREGDAVRWVAPDGRELDALRFGRQVSDLALARFPDGTGEWSLARWRPDLPIRREPYLDGAGVRINEWLAAPRYLASSDFVELHNAARYPALLAGGVLTENAIGEPDKARLSAWSFLGAGTSGAWDANGGTDPDEVNFRLASEGGSIAWIGPDGTVFDEVFYGPQRTDVAEGRSPDGSDAFRAFAVPTPGANNPADRVKVETIERRIPLLDWTQVWRYRDDGADPGSTWQTPEFSDASWLAGPGLLYRETATLPGPKSTPIRLGPVTHYFRTRFQVEVPPGQEALGVLELNHLVDDGAVFWLNGEEWVRFNMPTGAIGASTEAPRTISDATLQSTNVALAGRLRSGENVLAVEVHQSDPDSTDVVFGASLAWVRFETNVVALGNPVRLNEVLTMAAADAPPNAGADWVELFNTSDHSVDLSDASLTDDPTRPRRYVVPSGTRIEPGGYWWVHATPTGPGSTNVLGFGLADEGGAVYWFDAPARGGGLLDVLVYGQQVRGRTVGRVPDGADHWTLTVPTPGGRNEATLLGSPTSVRINEWLAAHSTGSDWIELFQSGPLPVALAGCSLTDDPLEPRLHEFPPLSFLGTGAQGYLLLLADGRGDLPGHVGFRLAQSGETLLLHGPGDASPVLDAVAFGPQEIDVTEGRFPDGGPGIERFPGIASPGLPNRRTALPGDLDGDGLPDDWERAHGLRIDDGLGVNGPVGDPDGDGLDNLSEWRAGTDPRDAGSRLGIEVVRVGGEARLRFGIPAGRAGALQRLAGGLTPAQGAWTTVEAWTPDPAPRTLEYPLAATNVGDGSAFFRLAITVP